MTRYFYTCPIEAAFMAKHFGMKFQNFWQMNMVHCEPIEDVGVVKDGDVKYYIHPDSLPLLEPQHDDHGVNDFNEPFFVAFGRWVNPLAPARDNKEFKIEITRRNGIAFLWPKEEA